MTIGGSDVIVHADGSASLPGGVDGDWHIHQVGGVWVADSSLTGRLRSGHNPALEATFRSRDEAIAVLVGDPQ